jgi:hypothetical protein
LRFDGCRSQYSERQHYQRESRHENAPVTTVGWFATFFGLPKRLQYIELLEAAETSLAVIPMVGPIWP